MLGKTLFLISISLTLLSVALSLYAAAKTLPLPKLGEDPVTKIATIVIELGNKHQRLTRLLINTAEKNKTLGVELSSSEYAELCNVEEIRSNNPQAAQQVGAETLESLLKEISCRSRAQLLIQLSALFALLAALTQLLEKFL
ncbi:hypothetical protein [Comamonas sp. HJ-2]